jgi:hypothetical protein
MLTTQTSAGALDLLENGIDPKPKFGTLLGKMISTPRSFDVYYVINCGHGINY